VLRLEVRTGLVEGYYCQCNFYNDILSLHCKSCSVNNASLTPLAFKALYRRNILIHWEGGDSRMDNDKRVELHSKFYNNPTMQGMIPGLDIANEPYEKLVEWEDTLEEMVIEAKAKMQRSSSERRERQTKMSKEERDKLVSRPNITGSEAIIQPKVRKDRQTTADKTIAGLANLGISDEYIKQLMGAIPSSGNPTLATKTHKVNDNTKYVFNGTPDPVDDDDDSVKSKIEEKKNEPKPQDNGSFDPSKLFG
jgi:hypothetical protein